MIPLSAASMTLLNLRRENVLLWVLTVVLACSHSFGQGRANPLTPAQAKVLGERLLGKPPEAMETYFSKAEATNYLALKSGREVWLYRMNSSDVDVQPAWHHTFDDVTNLQLDRFLVLPNQDSPVLRMIGYSGGSSGQTTTLALYSVSLGNLYWIDYSLDRADPGIPRVQLMDGDAGDETVQEHLKAWAAALGVDRIIVTDPYDIRNIEEAWLRDNRGHIPGTITLRYYPRINTKGGVLTGLDDKPFQWTSYFKGPVVGYDASLRRYFPVVVPDNGYQWVEEFKLVGPWLYMRENQAGWRWRYNKVTHRLESGDYELSEKGQPKDVHPAAGGQAPAKPLPSSVVSAYDLLQDPFSYKGKTVVLAPSKWPRFLNGQLIEYSPVSVPIAGYMGMRFNRMLQESVALYDALGQNNDRGGGEMEVIGQIVLLLPRAQRPNVLKNWVVQPLGTTEGTNYFGAHIAVPLVRLVRYSD